MRENNNENLLRVIYSYVQKNKIKKKVKKEIDIQCLLRGGEYYEKEFTSCVILKDVASF